MANIPVTGPGERGRPRTPEEIEADRQAMRDAAGPLSKDWQAVQDAANKGPRTDFGQQGDPKVKATVGVAPDPQDLKDYQTRMAAKGALQQLMEPIAEDPNARIAKERQLKAQAGQARLQSKGQYSRAGMGSSGAAGYGQATTAMQAAQGVGRGMEQFDRARRMEAQQRQFAAAGLAPTVGRLGMEQEAFNRAMAELRQQQIDIAGDVGDVISFTSQRGEKLNATIVASHNDVPATAAFAGETNKDGKTFRVVKYENQYYAYPITKT